MPPCEIVPALADEGEYIASESTFYRILREEKMQNHRGRSQEPGKHGKLLLLVKRLFAGVYFGRVRHTARSFRTRLPEFEDTLSVIWTHPVPVKQVSASGTGCY